MEETKVKKKKKVTSVKDQKKLLAKKLESIKRSREAANERLKRKVEAEQEKLKRKVAAEQEKLKRKVEAEQDKLDREAEMIELRLKKTESLQEVENCKIELNKVFDALIKCDGNGLTDLIKDAERLLAESIAKVREITPSPQRANNVKETVSANNNDPRLRL